MRRKVMPTVLVLFALMIDTAVIPFLISSPYLVSLTFATVLVLGVYLGRMHGMLYGMIAGLLTDILVSYQLGFNTFLFIGLGFLAGTIAYEAPSVRLRKASSRVYLRRALTFAGMALVRETVIFGYQYFNTALFSGVYLLNILARTLLSAGLCMLLGPLEARAVLGRPVRYQRTSPQREVKSF